MTSTRPVPAVQPAPRAPAPRSPVSVWAKATGPIGIGALVIAAVLTSLVALVLGGGAAAPLLSDPGAVARYGLPTAKLISNLAAAGTIGSLLLAVIALSPARPEFGRALNIAAVSGALWTLAAGATGYFAFLTIYQQPFSLEAAFGEQLAFYFGETSLGRPWLITMIMAAAITVICFAVRSPAWLAVTTVIAVAALWPVAQTGHAGGTADHASAITAVYLHSVFAAIWVGGLLALALLRGAIGDRLPVVLARYSSIALIAFIVVAITGVVNAQIRVGGWEGLDSAYGVILLSKVAALTVLAGFGVAYRRVLIGRIAADRRPRSSFWAVVVADLVIMGVASGLAAALSRTPPPVAEVPTDQLVDPTPAELLTGAPLPPVFEPIRLLTEWDLNLLWALLAGFGAFFYLAGAWRLHRRGDAWPVHRTILWVTGMVSLFIVTSSGFAVYEKYLFSVHMLGHMILSMAIPVTLVLAAPVTLAARAIAVRKDGSRGPREWILAIVHSRWVGLVGHPVIAAVIFAVSLIAFYYSPLFSWAVTDHLGHQWMILHFLLSGFLFVNALIGIDPAPYRPVYPIRLMILLATMAFHAFFGLSLITGTSLLLPEWFGAMGREWGDTPLADQVRGGEIAWSVGEIPTLALAILVAVMWSRDDTRETRRRDRQADRDGDAELHAYNEMLEQRTRHEVPVDAAAGVSAARPNAARPNAARPSAAHGPTGPAPR